MDKVSPHRRYLREFCSLSIRILRLANTGVPELEFLRGISEMLVRFSGCDALGLCLQGGNRTSSWRAVPHGSAGVRVEATQESEEMLRFCRDLLEGHFDPREPFFTRAGSFWTGEADRPVEFTSAADGQPRRFDLGAEGYRSLLIVPFVIDDSGHGMLSFRARNPGFFQEREIEFYEGLGHTLGVAVSDRRAQAALRERVKELTCLYGISQITRQAELALEETLSKIVAILPPAFLHPEAAAARILLDERSFGTDRCRESSRCLRSPIRVNGEERGCIEVCYIGDHAGDAEEPFLPEEHSLIDGVAKQIALLLESRQAEEDRRVLEEQLRHADRLATIGELAAGVAHELNEPLGNILGFAQLAGKTRGLPKQAAEDLERILKASLHAREVVKKLLIFARQMPTKKSRIELNRVVDEGLYFLESRCRKEGIELRRELAADLPPIIADPSQLNQVLVNLMVNSIQAMPRGGSLTVRTRAHPAGVALEVEDTGIGMNESIRRQIFIPFFTTKEVGQGTGLGLPVVHGIVSSHGGSIEVHSREGQGTRFTIILPPGGSE